MTGCLNYRVLHARLVEEAANATASHPLRVLILDVDHFKAINDGHGHPAGDEVRASLGALLRANFRAQDVVDRIGLDEFAVLLPYGGRVTIGSASTAYTTVDATEARRLLAAADAWLYAKRRRDRLPK